MREPAAFFAERRDDRYESGGFRAGADPSVELAVVEIVLAIAAPLRKLLSHMDAREMR